jgi:hypothetical protein
VREASAPSARKVQRRGVAWQLTRVGVPAAVIVIVGAGAVMMLTGKPSEILNTRADQNAHAPGSAQAGVARGAAGGQAVGFTGYPGLHGTVTVSSFAASGGTQLAVGGARRSPRDLASGGGRQMDTGAGEPACSIPGPRHRDPGQRRARQGGLDRGRRQRVR